MEDALPFGSDLVTCRGTGSVCRMRAEVAAGRGAMKTIPRSAVYAFGSVLAAAWLVLVPFACRREAAPPAHRPGPAPEGSGERARPDHRLEEFYAPDTVQTVELSIAPADVARMQAALPERIYVPGSFRWRDVIVEPVGIRYKGNSSSAPESPFKRGFLVRFDEFVKGARFLGLRRVALDNGIQFGGLYSEILILEVLGELGVPASRANYARLALNGEYMGVYVNVERIDQSFLDRHFEDATGVLYEVDAGGPGADFAEIDEGEGVRYAAAFAPKTHEQTADFGALAELMAAINDTPEEEIEARLEQLFELDDFLSTTAVLLLAGAFDQYTGWNPHNYYLYRQPSTGRWSYIPWDLDVGFAPEAFGHIQVLAGWNAAYPLPVAPRPLLERICRNARLLERYRAKADYILERYFTPRRIQERVDALHRLIAEDLVGDPFPQGRVTVPGDRSHADVVAGIKQFAAARYAKARRELDERSVTEPIRADELAAAARRAMGGEGPRPQGDGPAPGEASSDDPTDLRVVSASASGVELAWTSHAADAAAHIIQRCEGADCDRFQNYRPVFGPQACSFTDDGVRPGAVYGYRVYAVFPQPGGAVRASGPCVPVRVRVPGGG